MRRFLLLATALMFAGTWAMAQTTPGQSDQKGYNEATTGKTGTGRSVQGCLSNSDGQYTLTSDQGKAYMLTGDTSKLEHHVGHEVIISGTRKSAGNTAAASGESVGTMSTHDNQPTLDVMSVKHVSQTCKNSGKSQ